MYYYASQGAFLGRPLFFAACSCLYTVSCKSSFSSCSPVTRSVCGRRSTTEEEFERRVAEYQRRKQPEAALPADVRPSDLLVSGR